MTDKPQFDGKKVKVKLADVCTLTMGQSPSSNSYNEIGIIVKRNHEPAAEKE